MFSSAQNYYRESTTACVLNTSLPLGVGLKKAPKIYTNKYASALINLCSPLFQDKTNFNNKGRNKC